MDKETLMYSYAAGAIDGDGMVYISRNIENDRTQFVPFVALKNNSGDLVDFLKSTFGGMVVFVKSRSPRWAHGYSWRIKGVANCILFLKKVAQFSVYKKERMNLLMEFCENFPFIRGKIISDEENHRRNSYREKLCLLNDNSYGNEVPFSKVTKENCKNLSFWAYLAGVMDTDGSFSISRATARKDIKNPQHRPMIQMSMCSMDVINHIRENCTFGNSGKRRSSSLKRGCFYTWQVAKKKDCEQLLKNIIPYLISKKQQAEILLEFILRTSPQKYGRGGISKDELQFRENCYQKIIALNKSNSQSCEFRYDGEKPQKIRLYAGNPQSQRYLKGENPMDEAKAETGNQQGRLI